MEDINNEEQDTPTNPDEAQDSNPDESVDDVDDTQDDSEDNELQEKLSKAEELAKNYKIRAEKAEAAAKQAKDKPTEKQDDAPKKVTVRDLPLGDINALAGMHEDDAQKLINWAEFNKVSIIEAKKSKEWQAIQKINEEERTSAEATNTAATQRKSSVRANDDQLLKKVEAGTLTESEMQEAARARVRKMRTETKNTT